MGRSRKRKQELPVETSWRMVEGDHDSFDTSLVPDIDILDDDNALSSGPSNLSQLSQLSVLSSQSNGDWNIGSSQDNSTIQDFITKADDEKNILRSPFAPTIPGAVKQSSRPHDNAKRIEEPEFYMPRVDVDSSRRASSTGSARTIRPNDEAANARQRRNAKQKSPQSLSAKQPTSPTESSSSIAERLAVSLPHAIFDILAWAFGVIGMAFRFAQKPIAVALAIYLVFGALIFASNWLTQSVYTALSPVCNIPGLHYVVDLPFCPTAPSSSGNGRAASSSSKPVEFDGLMDVQERFEEVLEKSANGVSLPMEMKRSEASVRDLRTMVRYSQLRGKDELVLEFDGFIDTVRTASDDLQRFNVHVGSAVDAVISINRWTGRYLDGLVASADESRGWLLDGLEWLFAPFQPTLVMSERNLLDKYVEHTALVSERISALIDEAYEVLRTLKIAEGHLDVINDFVVRTSRDVHDSTKNDIWLTIFKMVGANVGRMRNINDQLRLLSRVDASRTTAVVQVTELIGDLTKIRDELQELRDAVKEPENVAYAASSETSIASGTLPLSVHIETIDRGVERLEHARRRIRAVENDRIREVMDRGRDGGEKLIESS